MNDLNYVLRTVEAVRVPQSEKNSMKIFVLIILCILLVGSFIFGENLFKELSWLVKLLLILLILNLIRTCRTAASIVRQEEQQALREAIELARKRQAQDAPPSESDES